MSCKAWVQQALGEERICVAGPFELKDTLKFDIPGARWGRDEVKAWTYPATPTSAQNIHTTLGSNLSEVDATFAALLSQAVLDREHQAVKTMDDEQLPEIPGSLPAWLHQKRAYHFALGRNGTMLAMDMGTGKSRTAVSLCDGWEAEVVVIIAPRSVVNVWPNQIGLHSERDWHIAVPKGRLTVAKRAEYIRSEALMARAIGKPLAVVVNYEAFWREPMLALLIRLVESHKSVVIADESHRAKAPGGKASRALDRLCGHADRKLFLTGTPMPHSPLDIYAQYRALDSSIFGTSFTLFRARYAVMGGYEGKQVVGYQREPELIERFGQAAFIVRKEDAGLDLPEVVHERIGLSLDPKALKVYRELEDGFIAQVGEGHVTAANALVKLLRLQQVTSGYVRDDEDVDHPLHTVKQDALQEILEDLPEREPVVVFAKFHHDLDAVKAVCEKLGRRYGEVSGRVGPGKPAYGLNEHSQMREDVDVVALQLQSGGVGIDLTRSAYAVYYSMGYSLGDYAQSLARLDRPGQKRSVTYLHLVVRSTVDVKVYAALAKREDVVNAVLTGARDGTWDNDDEEVNDG